MKTDQSTSGRPAIARSLLLCAAVVLCCASCEEGGPNPTPANQRPSVQFTNCPGGVLTQGTFTFNWQGSDSDGDVAGYFFELDDSTPDAWTPNTYFTCTGLSNGSHVFYVQAEDDDGEKSDVASCGFQVAVPVNQPPSVWVTNCPGSPLSEATYTFTWQGSDQDGSVSGYYYDLDDASPDNWTTGTSHTYGGMANGDHTFYVKSLDNDGASSTVVSCEFEVAVEVNQPPDAWIENCPEAALTEPTYTFSWDGSDDDGSVAGYYYDLDDTTPDQWTTGTSHTYPNLADGAHTFYLKSVDNDGASSTVQRCDFDVSIDVCWVLSREQCEAISWDPPNSGTCPGGTWNVDMQLASIDNVEVEVHGSAADPHDSGWDGVYVDVSVGSLPVTESLRITLTSLEYSSPPYKFAVILDADGDGDFEPDTAELIYEGTPPMHETTISVPLEPHLVSTGDYALLLTPVHAGAAYSIDRVVCE